MDSPLNIFFSYAHEDEELMNDVRRQLIVYERNGQILKWHDRMIPPGTKWRDQIDGRLKTAEIVLLFMSPHFIESRYCYEVEGKVALERCEAGRACVVPIVLRPCAWEATPFGALQALPADAKPITLWANRDEACLDAARGVMVVVDELTKLRGASRPSKVSAPHAPAVSGAGDLKLIYCRRCGHTPGKRSDCPGHYTRQHDFVEGSANTYCKRCGVRPGMPGDCPGHYTRQHDFVEGSTNTYCKRCGVRPGMPGDARATTRVSMTLSRVCKYIL